jgi:hypothetical protein
VAPYQVTARNLGADSENRIHSDEVARRYGFTGALVPGVEVFAYLTAVPVAAWGEAWLHGGGFRVRFRRPVYDGEAMFVEPVPGDPAGLAVRGPDGQVRAVGAADPPAAAPPPVPRLPHRPLPATRPPASPDSLAPGPLGTVDDVVTAEQLAGYLDGVAEPSPLYRDRSLLHPGLLLRQVNELLIRNVELGPWIHTASTGRLLGIAAAGQALQTRGVVTAEYDRAGRRYVELDAQLHADGRPVLTVHHTAIHTLPVLP